MVIHLKIDSFDEQLGKNPLLKIDTIELCLLVFLAISVGYFLAWLLKDRYDPKYLIRGYLVYGIFHLVIGFLLLKAAVVAVLGSYLLGGVLTVFRSNRYFYG